jgi:hypothetical protein
MLLELSPSPLGEGLGWGMSIKRCVRRTGPTPLRLSIKDAKSHCPSPEGEGAD